MNEKEVAELRRRYRKDKSNISRVCGCFVNEKKEMIAEFDHSLGLMPEEESEQILSVMKKTLSGTVGRNLWEVNFSTEQVMESEEHRLLSELRSTELKDKDSVHKLYETIIGSLEMEGNYVILLAHDRYDVFSYSADGEKGESGQVFSYIVCCVCPVKSGRPALSYYLPGNCFRSICADTMLSAPEIGFLFPAFEDHGANIYKAMYYTKNLTDSHVEMVDTLFHSQLPMPAAAQKETFDSILEQTMEGDCSLKIVRSVHAQVCAMLGSRKEDGEEKDEPPVLTKELAGDMLRYCGVPEERVTAFEEKYEEEFGKDAEIHPKNVVNSKQMQLKTPEVTIKVSAGCGDVLETRVIDGVRYILVRADSDVVVNGVNIHI
ncbi:MAG: DUF4317 domain-containing protein [Clostridia bacterium]|nr:DUF4317 domain-containing protein [Clostridia bacterium]